MDSAVSATINDAINSERNGIAAAEAAQKEWKLKHEALAEEYPEVCLALMRKMALEKKVELVIADTKANALRLLENDILQAVKQAAGIRLEIQLLRKASPLLGDAESFKRVIALEDEIGALNAQVKMMLEGLMQSSYDADEANLYTAFQMEANNVIVAAGKLMAEHKEDRIKGILLDVDVTLAQMGSMQDTCGKLIRDRSDILMSRLVNAQAASEAADVEVNKVEEKYAKALGDRAGAALKQLPELTADTPPLEVAARLLKVAEIIKGKHASVLEVSIAFRDLKAKVEGLRAEHSEWAAQLDEIIGTFKYQNIFPLGDANNAISTKQLEGDEDDQLIALIQAWDVQGAPDDITEAAVNAIGVKALNGFYIKPKAVDGYIDKRFIDQIKTINICIEDGVSKKALNEIYDEAYSAVEGLYKDKKDADVVRQNWILSHIKELAGWNEVMVGRISQLLNNDMIDQVSSIKSQFKEGLSGTFVSYNGNCLHIAEPNNPHCEFLLGRYPNGDLFVRVGVKWRVDGHASQPDAAVHQLNKDKPSFFEASFTFCLEKSVEPKPLSWREWAGLSSAELNDADYAQNDNNPTASLIDYSFIAVINDKLVASARKV